MVCSTLASLFPLLGSGFICSGRLDGYPFRCRYTRCSSTAAKANTTDQGKQDRDSQNWRMHSLFQSRSTGERPASQVTRSPLILPDRDDSARTPQEIKASSKVLWCIREDGRQGTRHLPHMLEELDNRETKPYQRDACPCPRHHRAFDTEGRVRNQPKWVSAVTLTSGNLSAPVAVLYLSHASALPYRYDVSGPCASATPARRASPCR